MKIALVHDHLAQSGGAERVLASMQQVFPSAPTYTLVHDRRVVNGEMGSRVIRTSFLQRLPLGVRRYQWYMPLMPAAMEAMDLMGHDVVVSSASAFAKGVITRSDALHVCYCHTPTRFLWDDTHGYVRELASNRLVKKLVPLAFPRLRLWDRTAADRVDVFVANSKTVQRRIRKYYGRKSVVIHPPVRTSAFRAGSGDGGYYLAGGRLVAYKRFDVAVQAFNRLGLPLRIFGQGPELERLRRMARSNVRFLGRVSEEKKAALYRRAIAYVNPQEEDFGITAIEAMASGRPVIAYHRGGASETVIHGKTGQLIDEQSWEALGDAVIRFRHRDYDPDSIREHALQYDESVFRRRMAALVERAWQRRHELDAALARP